MKGCKVRTARISILVITAMTLMCAASGAPAMAENTALCSVDEKDLTCDLENQVKDIHFEDPASLLSTNIVNILCEALLEGEVLALDDPQLIHGLILYSLCHTSSKMACVAKDLGEGTLLSVLKTDPELAEVTGLLVTLYQCGSFFHCAYSTENATAHALGALEAPNGHITMAAGSLQKVSGFLCPSEAKLGWLFQSLSPIYIRS
jgi:hypothetical protein